MVFHDDVAVLVGQMSTAIRDTALAFPGLERAFAVVNISRLYWLHCLSQNSFFTSVDHDRAMMFRFGDSVYGVQIQRVSAADLKTITTPFRPQSERQKMTADEWYSSEHGKALREERNRHADQRIREQQVRQAEAAVEFFLPANRDYARTDDNREGRLPCTS